MFISIGFSFSQTSLWVSGQNTQNLTAHLFASDYHCERVLCRVHADDRVQALSKMLPYSHDQLVNVCVVLFAEGCEVRIFSYIYVVPDHIDSVDLEIISIAYM